jgi:hypothetical protein
MMKNKSMAIRFLIFILVLASACLEPYEPPTSKSNPEFLVVDAFLNTTPGRGAIEVTLSYTTPLNSSAGPAVDDYAAVELYNDAGNYIPLFWMGKGKYAVYGDLTTPNHTYKIHIKTGKGREYESDLISLTEAPPIDSVNHVIDAGELEVNVNTHDPSGKSRFYKWNFIETWEYRSQYASGWILVDKTPLLRPAELDINTCWRTDTLKKIIVGTSNLLAEDLITNFNLIKIPEASLKLQRKYSILVQQQTLTPAAYDYWLSLQKSTESLGGLFDPMPSQVDGNIHSLNDPNEKVIGYFSGGTVAEKRIFIKADELPETFADYRPPLCQLDTVLNENLRLVYDPDALISAVYPPGFPVIIGYTTADKTCIDCRDLAGGVTTRPYFWE